MNWYEKYAGKIKWGKYLKTKPFWTTSTEEAKKEKLVGSNNELKTKEGVIKIKKNEVICKSDLRGDYWAITQSDLKNKNRATGRHKDEWTQYEKKPDQYVFAYQEKGKEPEVTTKSGHKLTGKKGDYVVKSKDGSDKWIVEQKIFKDSYKKIS